MSATARHLGKYELQQLIGRGNVGEVWLAHDPQLHEDVAVKVLHNDLQSDPHFLTRFTRGGQAVALLHHTNIVQVYDANIAREADSNETSAYIAMDYIQGPTLTEYIRATVHRGNIPSVAQIVYLFTSLSIALDYAHQKHIVHGSIKPANILLNQQNKTQFEGGEPMLTDFGLSQFVGSAATTAAPFYMSPEQAKGFPANHRSDIYSLGVMLYEICTGVQPFRDESSVAVMMQHINALPTPPILINPNIPAALSEVILRAMAKDPLARYPSASSLATAIADACSMHLTLHQAQIPDAEDMSAYTSNSLKHQAILGVSQPLPNVRPFSSTGPQPIVGPFPSRNSGPVPSVSSGMPAMPTNVPPSTSLVPANTNKYVTPFYSPQDRQQTGSMRMAITPMPIPQAQSPLPPMPGQKNVAVVPVRIVIGALLLLLLVIGSALAGSIMLNRQMANNNMTGHAFFQDDALGTNDQLSIEIPNVAAPPAGKNYFAWLQTPGQLAQPLGVLPMHNGTISFLYQGDGKHTNLLSITQEVIITQEDTAGTLTQPSSTVVYEGMFDPHTMQQIKNILGVTPNFPGNQSVVRGLLDTIKSMNDKAGSVADTLPSGHDNDLVKRQATRILEMIDGTQYAKSSGDVPANVPTLLSVPVGILSSPGQPGYLETLNKQLDALKQAAGTDSPLLQHIQNVKSATTDLANWIQAVRKYAAQILQAPNLADPALISVGLQLKQAAADSYTGRTIAPNPGPLPILGSAGAYQAYTEAQYLATLDLRRV